VMDLDRTGEAYLGDGPVPDGDAEAVAEEVGRHCLPHDAEPQEPYLHLGFLPVSLPTSGLPCERPDGASVQMCSSSPLSSLPANPRILYNFSFLYYLCRTLLGFFARSTRQQAGRQAGVSDHRAFEGRKEWSSRCDEHMSVVSQRI
jgi:hypothetical protein